MSALQPARPRSRWQPRPGEDALLLYFIFGDFPRELKLPLARHGSRGLPAGVQLYRHPHAALREWAGYPLSGALGEILREDDPATVARAELAAEVLSVRGTVADPSSLDYLDDTMGVIAGLLDLGGSAVVDPQTLSLHSAAAWRERFAGKAGRAARGHVLILANAEADGTQWVHTRGMRKLARPDLSVRGVPPGAAEAAGIFCHKLVDLLADGLWIEDGQAVEIEGLPGALAARLDSDHGNPRFNNSHLEFTWPAG